MSRLGLIFSSLSTAMNRWSTRCEPKAPSPQPTALSMNTSDSGSPLASVNGLRKPVDSPNPEKGSSVENMSVSGRMTKPASMIIAWNTSVLETARKPPMKVLEATAISVMSTLTLWPVSNTISSSLAPAISPELT